MAGGLPGPVIESGCHPWLASDNLLMPHLPEQGAHGCFMGVSVTS
jgi:hypothetical protein